MDKHSSTAQDWIRHVQGSTAAGISLSQRAGDASSIQVILHAIAYILIMKEVCNDLELLYSSQCPSKEQRSGCIAALQNLLTAFK